VPEDARPSRPPATHHLDELVDALGLLLRTARDLDPARADSRVNSLEADAEQTIVALQALESAAFEERDHAALNGRVAAVAASTRGELLVVIERALSAIRTSLLTSD
jgi:hypothetical protein